MTAHFELQPSEKELQQLAEQCWQEAPNRERHLEEEAFEAGDAIRHGDYSLANLEAIVRWKSERLVQYVIANSNTSIRRALEVAAAPESSTAEALSALLALRGVEISLATSILAAIYPERYIELDMADLEALGQARQDVRFYEEYLTFCQRLVDRGIVKPQSELPGPTPLHALDRALVQWSRNRML
ncbi:MAG: hypothetical protein WBQ95_19570 [Terracidiphilus sp.]